MRNIANVSRREIDEARVLVNGVTASVPGWIAVDVNGNKEFAADVYIGPLLGLSIIYRVPIVSTARAIITDIRQPVQLERSKQGFYTIVGRAKVMAAGAQTPDMSILEPTFREIEVNLAQLNILHVADLDYAVSEFQATPDTELQSDPDQEFQTITATDAFGHAVTDDPEGDCIDATASITPVKNAKTRHVRIDVAKFGPYGDPLAMRWGDPDSEFQPAVQEVIELED